MTLAQKIEHAPRSALQRHVQSALGTVAQIVPTSGPGQPVKIAGFFFLANVCRDVVAMVETHRAAAANG
jgi:hypothetical protein